jgi:hypothetical protein
MSNKDFQERGFIYRFVEFHRAAEIFEQKALFFSRPSQWPDPYEVRVKHSGADALFAQCWCQTAMTESMWRIYSPHGTAVRIRTTKERLRVALASWAKNNGHEYREGLVDYKGPADTRQFYRELEADLAKRYTAKRAADALFVKREAFEHENEWRAVLTCRKVPKGDVGISVALDPHALIDQVVLDPRAPTQLVDALALYFKVKLGFKGEVKVSSLYKRPADIVIE